MWKQQKTSSAKSQHPTVLPHWVLLIEEDVALAQELAYALEQKGAGNVVIAGDPFEAANWMSRHSFDLIVTDWRLSEHTSFSALRRADHELSLDPNTPQDWYRHKKVPVIVLTDHDGEEVERERKLKGRFQFLGAVAKKQPLGGLVNQLELLYKNFPLAATG